MNEYIKKNDALCILAKNYINAYVEINELKPSLTIDVCREEEEEKDTEAFGYKLKQICKDNGITIKEVAENTGIPSRTLYNITKRNTKKPRGDVQEKVFNYLDKRVEETNNANNNDNKELPERNR